MTDYTLLIVPGLRDHVPAHWQTHLQADWPGAQAVPPLAHFKLSLDARVQALHATVQAMAGPIRIAAHSAGVLITVHWALRHPALAAARIDAALLATPSDVERPLPEGYPTMDQLHDGGWLPTPRTRLPFRATVALSRNDPLCDHARATTLAADWGASVVDLGEVGHLNPASGFGPWPQAKALIHDLA